jgi:hypothetical protein
MWRTPPAQQPPNCWRRQVAGRVRSEELAVHDRIVSIDTLGSSAAAAKVQVALPASGGGSTLFTDFLVLLRLEEEVSAAVNSALKRRRRPALN